MSLINIERPSRFEPWTSVTVCTMCVCTPAALGAALQDYEGLIMSLSSGTFLVFQALLIAVMVSRSVKLGTQHDPVAVTFALTLGFYLGVIRLFMQAFYSRVLFDACISFQSKYVICG